jgi:hypothetical protein
MCVLIFSTAFVWAFLTLRRSERDVIRHVYWSSCEKKAHYSYPILMRRLFSTIFEKKYSNTKFHEDPSSWSRVIPCGRTTMMKLIVAFRNFANTLKIALQPGSKSMSIFSAEPRPWTKRQCCNTCCGKFVDEYPTVAALMGQQFPSSFSVTEIVVFTVVNSCWFVFVCLQNDCWWVYSQLHAELTTRFC